MPRPVSVVSPDFEGEGSDQTDLDEAGKAGRQAVLLTEKNWWSQTATFSQRAEISRLASFRLCSPKKSGVQAQLSASWEP